MDPHHEPGQGREESNLKTGLHAIGIAVIVLAIIMGFSHWLALHG